MNHEPSPVNPSSDQDGTSQTVAFVADLVRRYPELAPCTGRIGEAISALTTCFAAGAKLLLCGNGGSAADAEHIVGELVKGFERRRPLPEDVAGRLEVAHHQIGPRLRAGLEGGLPAISLAAHGAFLTAYINDADPELVFAQGVMTYGRGGDVLMCLSTSGDSPNVVAAAVTARALGLVVIAITGASGGALGDVSDVLVAVPAMGPAAVQELHLPVYHTLCRCVEAAFWEA